MSGPRLPGDNTEHDAFRGVRDRWSRLPGWGKVAAVCVPVLIVIIVVAAGSGSGTTTRQSRSSSDISGSLQDWIGKVCPSRQGSSQANVFPGSPVSGVCLGDFGVSSSPNLTVFYNVFTSVERMREAMSIAGVGYYATAYAPDGSVTIFMTTVTYGEQGKRALEPLTSFGFDVVPGPITMDGEAPSTTSRRSSASSPTSSYSPPTSEYVPTSAPPPISRVPNPNTNLTPTSRAILSAQPGDCIGRRKGRDLGNGSTEVVVVGAVCGGADATDMVTVVMYTDQPTCEDWVRSRAVTPPKVLCLKPAP